MRRQFSKIYDDIISLDNLFSAWEEFVKGKRNKQDIQEFQLNLTDTILQLHWELANFSYKHGPYQAFNISDPKPRNIHKAEVRDRVLHHAIYRQLYSFFDRTFIADSYSCRINKGVHKAIDRFRRFGLKVSKNNTRTVWVLKMDIRKFFASIDHGVLLGVLKSYIPDKDIIRLLKKVADSFQVRPLPQSLSRPGEGRRCGLPLGNLTSQLFCNVYMNEFDQFVKHKLKVKYYLRYADDFVLLSDDKDWLQAQILAISEFLQNNLKLSLHPDKIVLKTLASGVDFLGWAHFSTHWILRKSTRRRVFRRIVDNPAEETLQSYLGLISHGNTFGLEQEMLNWYGLFNLTQFLFEL